MSIVHKKPAIPVEASRAAPVTAQSVVMQLAKHFRIQRALCQRKSRVNVNSELRGTMSLARLWLQQGRRDEACGALAAIYGAYT